MTREETGWWCAAVGLWLVSVFFFGLAAGLAGCSSPLRAHAAAVTVAHAVLDSGGEAVMDARAAELDRCTDPACAVAGEERWSPWVASLRLAAEAWAAWRDAVVSGFGLPDEAVAAQIAAVALRHLLDVWAALRDVLATAGVEVPEIPDLVLAVLR